MAASIRFLDVAQLELDEAVEYYNRERAGLGDEFLTEVLSALDRIGRLPEAWHLGRVVPEFRTASLRELIHPPFRIVYW